MAHFAKIVNGKVEDVIVVKNEDCGGGDFPESEVIGQEFIASIGIEGEWIQTSYNCNFRKNFAGCGMTYSQDKDLFHSDAPFESWVLNDEGRFDPPVERPEGDGWIWNEESVEWTQ